MEIQISKQQKILSSNKEFQYGGDGYNCLLLAMLFPCFFGCIPTQAYNTIVFNNQKQRIQKYYNGFGIWVCCSPKLETIINYNEITSIDRQRYIYKWHLGSGDVNIIVVSCGEKQTLFFLPENACFVSEETRCCNQQLYANSCNCCEDKYEKLSQQIVCYWQSIQRKETQRSFINRTIK